MRAPVEAMRGSVSSAPMSTGTVQQTASRGKLIAAFAAVYIIWGSTYLAIRFALETLPPFLMAGARFLTAGAIVYALSAKIEMELGELEAGEAAVFMEELGIAASGLDRVIGRDR